MNPELKNRLKSLAWRVGGMLAVVILEGVIQMASDGTIVIPAPYVVFAGLILGEITKYLNTK